MDFQIDAQTKHDLNLFPELRNDVSVFGYFDVTRTKGGRSALYRLFNNPSNDLTLLINRSEAIRFFIENKFDLEFQYLALDFVEHYLSENILVLRDNVIDGFAGKLWNTISPKNEYYIISRGIDYLKAHFARMKEFATSIDTVNVPVIIKQIVTEINEITAQSDFQLFLKSKRGRFRFINADDRLIRKTKRTDVLKILEHTYLLDALSSVAAVAVKNNLTLPDFNDSTEPSIGIKELFHPFLTNPVSNDIKVGTGGNLCFISGPNMAGKSTFLKSVGICIYLAHLGFPVPAKHMRTSLFNGIFSSINLSDSINQGYSHYYSEVRRVKEITLAIKERNRVCVLFDELFKGTNVKDAYDATLMVMTGFAKMKASIFFASTHIIEVAADLKKQSGIIFKYLDFNLNGGTPIYSYKLLDGISSERLGLLIVKQEGIMKIIDEILSDAKS